MNYHEAVGNYETLSVLTGQMRTAAQEGEWDHLVELEQKCSRQVATMRPMDERSTLDETNRQRKIQLIKQILADDADIRNRTQTWMAQLQSIIQSNRKEQRLHQAYES
jgi:flagellar protein FliT